MKVEVMILTICMTLRGDPPQLFNLDRPLRARDKVCATWKSQQPRQKKWKYTPGSLPTLTCVFPILVLVLVLPLTSLLAKKLLTRVLHYITSRSLRHHRLPPLPPPHTPAFPYRDSSSTRPSLLSSVYYPEWFMEVTVTSMHLLSGQVYFVLY